jgi:adenylate cyclase
MVTKDAVRQSERPPSLLFALSMYVGATLFANFVAAVSNNLLSPLIYTQADQEAIMEILKEGNGLVVSLLAFLVPSIVATIYIWPIYRACLAREHRANLPLTQRRLLTMPLVLGVIGLCGWLIGLVDFVPAALRRQEFFVSGVVLRYVLNDLLTGSLVFVISYYLLEFINRKYFIPKFFPGGKLSECKGTLVLSIRARFYIFFFAVAIFPLFLMLSIVRAMGDVALLSDKLLPVTILVGVVLVLGAFLTYLISRSYQVPLVEMERAAQRIQASDYDIDIAVVSNDEVGNLGEALNDMAAALQEKEFIKDTFGKVVDPRVRDYLLSGHIDLGGEVREAAVLFADIRGFTTISAKMKPDQVVDWLNRYFEKMSQCIVDEGGIVNKYVGDAILAVFGVPLPLDNHTAAAVRAALQMRIAREALNADLLSAGLPPIHSGIGIHVGPVLAGNIGASSRMEYTVIGDAVNVASRIEEFCKNSGHDLILSEPAMLQLGAGFEAQDLGPVEIRGKEQPLRLFSLK